MGGLGQDGAVCSSERVRCPPRARLNDMNSSRSDRPEQDHRDGIDAGNHGPTRPSEPCAARHSSGSSRAVPRRSAGAIAAVLFTVLGALALSFGFAKVITGTIGDMRPLWPENVTVKVSWSENEGENDGEKDPPGFDVAVPPKVVGYQKGYLILPVTRSDLRFDLIEEKAEGWPPDLAGPTENGLVSYSIEIIYDYGERKDAEYIVRTNSPDQFILLVPHAGTRSPITTFDDKTVFKVEPQGVIDLANEEKEKPAQR